MYDLLHKNISNIVNISQAELDQFAGLFTVRKLKKRQFFLQEGDVCRYQAFVLKGIMRAFTVDEKGAEHVLQFASEGWWSADLSSYLTNEPSYWNIEALEDVELLLLSRPLWEQAMKDIPELQHYFRVIIQNHLVATQKRLLQSLSETADVKYKRFVETYPDCVQRLPQHQIASYLGITRETLSRVRRQAASK